MKMTTDVVIVIGIFILVIVISLVLSTGTVFVPYSPDTIFPKYGAFSNIEGLANKKGSKDSSGNNPEGFDNRVFTPQTINQNVENCAKVYGFDGLYCSPNNSDYPIDKFSEVKGNGHCLESSSGLSNSKGYLCLGPDLIKSLRTRGGNASGIDSQIGQR
jgi:hypothetical protein